MRNIQLLVSAIFLASVACAQNPTVLPACQVNATCLSLHSPGFTVGANGINWADGTRSTSANGGGSPFTGGNVPNATHFESAVTADDDLNMPNGNLTANEVNGNSLFIYADPTRIMTVDDGGTGPRVRFLNESSALIPANLSASEFNFTGVINGDGSGLTNVPSNGGLAAQGSTIGTYDVGSTPQSAIYSAPNVWIANSGSDNVTKLLASDGSTVGTYSVGDSPAALSVADGVNLWVVNNGDDTLTQLLISDGSTVGTYPTCSGPVGVAATANGTSVYVVCSDGTAEKHSASDGSLTWAVGGSTTAGAAITVFDAGFFAYNLWFINPGEETVTALNESDGSNIGTYLTTGTPYDILNVADTDIYVKCAGGEFTGPEIDKYNISGTNVAQYNGSLGESFTGPGLAYDGKNIWATSETDNTVMVFNINSPTRIGNYATGSAPAGVVAAGSSIYVANSGDDTAEKLANTNSGAFSVTALIADAFYGNGSKLTNISWSGGTVSGVATFTQPISANGGITASSTPDYPAGPASSFGGLINLDSYSGAIPTNRGSIAHDDAGIVTLTGTASVVLTNGTAALDVTNGNVTVNAASAGNFATYNPDCVDSIDDSNTCLRVTGGELIVGGITTINSGILNIGSGASIQWYRCTGSTSGTFDGNLAAGNDNAGACAGGTWVATGVFSN